MTRQHVDNPLAPVVDTAPRRGRDAPKAFASGLETLRRELEELGLGTYEARVLLALLRLGSASPARLARSADVPRTSTYQVLEELQAKGLAVRLPSDGPAVWTCPGPDEIFARLEAAEEERLHQYRARSERVREMVAEALPEAPVPALPYVQVIHEPARVKPVYEHLLDEARSELLVFNRPPYSWPLGRPNPIVVATSKRVRTRVLYQSSELHQPDAEDWRQEMEAYHAAGVEGRVVEKLPMKLAVVDRKVALLSLDDPVLANVGFPTSLLVEHPGFAAVQADAFEHLWETAQPYESATPRRARAAATGAGRRRPIIE